MVGFEHGTLLPVSVQSNQNTVGFQFSNLGQTKMRLDKDLLGWLCTSSGNIMKSLTMARLVSGKILEISKLNMESKSWTVEG